MTPQALIVTSDFELCHMVRVAVERFGITAAIALSPSDALQQLGRNKFDLVLVDCSNLEHGCAALRKMRLNPTHQSAVAVAVVANRDHTRYVCDSGANFVVAHANYQTEVACTLRSAYGLVLRERGRYNRFPLTSPVTIRAGRTQREAQLLNISQGGVCISGIAQPISGAVQLRFALENDKAPLQVTGNVVWHKEQCIGVQFAQMTKACRTELETWLAAQFEGQTKGSLLATPALPRDNFDPAELERAATPGTSGGIRPIVIAIIRGGPVRARCSACQAAITFGDTVGQPLEQERKLREAFLAHVQDKHQPQLAEVLAASAV